MELLLAHRLIGAFVTAIMLCIVAGKYVIGLLNTLQMAQSIREVGPQSHLEKSGTPTMGGVLIIAAVVLSTLLWSHFSSPAVGVVLWVLLGTGAVGFYDDWLKVRWKNSKGVSARMKFGCQSIVALSAFAWLFTYHPAMVDTRMFLPFVAKVSVSLGWAYGIWIILVVVGSSNALNLTDGLDGLATMPMVMIVMALGVIAFMMGKPMLAHSYALPYIAGLQELSICCAAMMGAGLGFLWFNAYPAAVFMGDVGALSLGATMGTIALLVKQEWLFMFMSAVLVAETLSVVIQVASFKLRGKRIFKMAPLHHHYEMIGWSEPTIITRFWIITMVLVLVCLASVFAR
jgi:phospho-N-acetylmuramoyl-pentapeptide-transferase